MTALSWRIVSGSVDLDVTDKVRGTPSLSWNSLGGCEVARVKVDLPLSTFPDLDEQSRLIVTDPQGRSVWEGYCTDPGGVDDDAGEAFDLLASGAMVLASDKVEPLVYRDAELSTWTRTASGTEAGQASTYDDDTLGTGWLVAHPQGYAIGTGAAVGIEYRALEHASQSLGAVTFTVAAGAADAGFVLRVTTYNDGALVNTIDYALATGAVTRTLVAGTDFTAGVDVIAISLVRVGAATNVTTGLAYVRFTALAVAGSRLTRFGAAAPPTAPLTSKVVIEDLIGRGMLAQVDPHRAVVDDSAALHTQLAFPDGTRGAAVITKLRETDPDMVWMYGARGPGGTTDAPAGHDFIWTAWSPTEVRYDLTEADTVSRPGGDDGRCHRISVFYRESETGPLKREVVQVADPGGSRLRDADPINLGVSTQSTAIETGQSTLDRMALTGSAGTATVARLILDRATGMNVEPWEIRPGSLARVQSSGDLLRVTEVSCDAGNSGATATLTLGDPTQTLEDRVLSFLRGENDPTAPLITLPPSSSAPPVPAKPKATDGLAPASSPTVTWRAGIGSVFLSWTPVANADTVTYRVLIGTSPALVESASTLAGRASGDFFIARELPNGTPFANDTTYYARVIASDADGDAAAGPVASGTVIAKITKTQISDGAIETPQLAANAVSAEYLMANNAWIGVLRATSFYGEEIAGLTVTSGMFRTAAAGQRMVLRSDTTGGILEGYTGFAGETSPAKFDINDIDPVATSYGRRSQLTIAPPDFGRAGGVLVLRSNYQSPVPGGFSIGGGASLDGSFGATGGISADGMVSGASFYLNGIGTIVTSGGVLQNVTLPAHTHDYAATSHTHDYAASGHTHSYSPIAHTHSYYFDTFDAAAYRIQGNNVINSSRDFVGASVNVGGTVTGQNIFANGQTGAAAGAAEFSAAGRIQRLGSSRNIKHDIASLSVTVDQVLALDPKSFRRNEEGDDGPLYPGFIAEDAADAGLELWVQRNLDGTVQGFRYSEFCAAQQVVLRDLHHRLNALEAAA